MFTSLSKIFIPLMSLTSLTIWVYSSNITHAIGFQKASRHIKANSNFIHKSEQGNEAEDISKNLSGPFHNESQTALVPPIRTLNIARQM